MVVRIGVGVDYEIAHEGYVMAITYEIDGEPRKYAHPMSRWKEGDDFPEEYLNQALAFVTTEFKEHYERSRV